MDHRPLHWLHNFKEPDALAARWLKKLAAFDYDIEHRSGKIMGNADCMPRLPETTAALKMTATMDVDASAIGQPNPSLQTLPSFNSHTAPTQPSHRNTIPRDTDKSNQTDDEPSGITNGQEAGSNKPVSQFTVTEQQEI